MYTRMAPEKKPDPYSGGKIPNSQKKTSTTEKKTKKLHVRSYDYRMIMQLILANPDLILPDEVLLLQRSVGYIDAMYFVKKAKHQKQLEKMGVLGENKRATPDQVKEQENDQLTIQKKSPGKGSDTSPKTEQVTNSHTNQDGAPEPKSRLPQALQNSLEKISGVSLSDVEVHKNSDKPQQLGAYAYTQGKDIYIAPGQDEYLPHEGWHAVQQRQGRVPPTLQMKSGLAINQDHKLEKEADIMGGKAEKESSNGEIQIEENPREVSNSANNNITQMAAEKKLQAKRKIRLWEPNSRAVAEVDADNTQTIELLKRNGYKESSESERGNWVLKVGNSNNIMDATVLQKVLVKSGYLDMPNDPVTQKHIPFGTYGELTKQAVMKFQKKMGLKADGIVGPDTWKAMQLPWSKETNEPHREHDQYQVLLNDKNIYNDGNKAADDKTPSNEKTKTAGGEINYLANIKSNLYILGYKSVYNDYIAARNQILKDYFDNGHSLHADFIRMGEGEHNKTVLEWTDKALAHKITRHEKESQGTGKSKSVADSFKNGFINFFISQFEAIKGKVEYAIQDPIGATIDNISELLIPYPLMMSMKMIDNTKTNIEVLITGDWNKIAERMGNNLGEITEEGILALISARVVKIVKAPKGTPNSKYNFSDQKKFDKHYDKHVVEQGEFGNITKDQYLQKANNFANSSGSNVLTRTGSNGDVLKFNPSTNEFSIVTKDGVIRTYHKLDPSIHGKGTNMDYWNGPDCNY